MWKACRWPNKQRWIFFENKNEETVTGFEDSRLFDIVLKSDISIRKLSHKTAYRVYK